MQAPEDLSALLENIGIPSDQFIQLFNHALQSANYEIIVFQFVEDSHLQPFHPITIKDGLDRRKTP